MADGDENCELQARLQRYQEHLTAKNVEVGKLEVRVTDLLAKVDYLERRLAEERAKQRSVPGRAPSGVGQPSSGRSVAPTKQSELKTPRSESNLNTPPPSASRSPQNPVPVANIDVPPSPLSPRLPRGATTSHRKRKPAVDAPSIAEDDPPPFTSSQSTRSPVRKKHKLIAEVVITPRRHYKKPFAYSPPKWNPPVKTLQAGPSKSQQNKDAWEISSESSLTPLSSMDFPTPVHEPAEEEVTRDVPPADNSMSAVPVHPTPLTPRRLMYPDPPVGDDLETSMVRSSKNHRPLGSSSSRAEHDNPVAVTPSNQRHVEEESDQRGRKQGPVPPSQPRLVITIPQRALAAVSSYARTASASMPVDRLAGLTRFRVHLNDPSLLAFTVTRAQMMRLYGGNPRAMCISSAGRNFLYPTVKLHPRIPREPGQTGLLLHGNDSLEWRGDVQSVFVGHETGIYKYVGEYKLTSGQPLSADEYKKLPLAVRKKWAKAVQEKSKFKDVRVRISARRHKARESTVRDMKTTVADQWEIYPRLLTAEEVMSAYDRGEEKLFVWRMQCVGFDEAFLSDLVRKL